MWINFDFRLWILARHTKTSIGCRSSWQNHIIAQLTSNEVHIFLANVRGLVLAIGSVGSTSGLWLENHSCFKSGRDSELLSAALFGFHANSEGTSLVLFFFGERVGRPVAPVGKLLFEDRLVGQRPHLWKVLELMVCSPTIKVQVG